MPSLCQSFYLKGQITDEKGNGISNLRIDLQSARASYVSGSGGYFGISSSRPADTLIIYYSRNDTVKKFIDASQFNTVVIRSEKLLSTRTIRQLSSISLNRRQLAPRQSYLANETYSTTVENPFFTADEYSATQLALSYNRASYSNLRRFLKLNMQVPPDAVRIEEMLNYFPWSYREPEPGETFRMSSVITPCPWNKQHQLLFLNVYAKKLQLENLPPSHLVFLIDVSSSMNLPNRLPLLKSAFRVLVANLRAKDTVSIVVYGGTTRVLLTATSGIEKQKITNVIDSLQAGGSTPGESGIKLAYKIARNHFIRGGNNRVILATDGDFNVGVRSEDELEQLITLQKNAGVYLTCLGVGMGDYKDSKIQALAQKGHGNFAYLDSYAEAEKVLFKEFFETLYTVADEVSMRVQFNNAVVKDYRLIGYDNKVSSIRDKTAVIQGGEIGAGNSLLIAFEIAQKNPTVEDTVADISLLYLDKTGTYRTFKYTAFYNSLQPIETDPSYQLASAVMMFGMKLKNSPYTRKTRWEYIYGLAKPVARMNYIDQELLQLMQVAKTIYKKERRFRLFRSSR
ncbi:MAG TPA: von Willebrand factor type A domain-containing protein [Flavisolibacter sp.]